MRSPLPIWQLLKQRGFDVEDPRPHFSLPVEEALEGELAEEVSQGEKEPEAVPDLDPNVRLIRQGDRRLLLYAIESVTEAGFWETGANEIRELKDQPLPWALVLLAGEGQGYWFTGQQVMSRVFRREIHAPGDVQAAKKFKAEPELLLLIESLHH